MNLFDLIFIILFVLCVVQSWIRKETYNIFFALFFLFGLWLVEAKIDDLQAYLEPLAQNQREAVVYSLFFIVTWFLGRIVGRFFGPMVNKLKSASSHFLQVVLSGLMIGWMFAFVVSVEVQLVVHSYLDELADSFFFPYLEEFRIYLHGLDIA